MVGHSIRSQSAFSFRSAEIQREA